MKMLPNQYVDIALKQFILASPTCSFVFDIFPISLHILDDDTPELGDLLLIGGHLVNDLDLGGRAAVVASQEGDPLGLAELTHYRGEQSDKEKVENEFHSDSVKRLT